MRSGDKLLTFLELTQFLHEWEGRGEGVLVREKKMARYSGTQL